MSIKIITVQFDYKQSDKYYILSKVFEASCKDKAPDIKFEIARIKEPNLIDRHTPSIWGKQSDKSNTEKLGVWLSCMEKSNDDIIFADCDMLMLNDPSKVFDEDFDIGITQCTPPADIPFNGGIVFAKNNDRAKKFIRLWDKINLELYNDHSKHKYWAQTKKYAGMNQAAFGCVWEEHIHKQLDNKICKIKFFPCRLYNAVRADWAAVNTKRAYFAHIKSEMRPRCLNCNSRIEMIEPQFREIVTIWRSYASALKLALPNVNINIKSSMKNKINRAGLVTHYKYQNYDDYIKTQKETTEKKVEKGITPWVKKENIKYLSEVLSKLINHKIESGICHGTRTGEEQKFFRVFLKADVIGTEICDKLNDKANTVIWDFNKENPEWVGKFDFVYSNSFDHSYKPSETIKIWMRQLKPGGFIVLEYTTKHNKPLPTVSDPVCFSAAEMIAAINSWTNGKWKVTRNLSGPQQKTINNISEIVKFLFIERSEDYAKANAGKK